ncbi:uncharacterized protein TrAFT101_003284 [Trichoderma asperellum]|uniref:uncharacterized protein n=1 Tax=Trichoderma asperellum TaxID=101201 RepID=UPI00331F002D|nr:hypothetical protein TrAFT101_003284 [Trichoderma asperellum]
MSPVIPPLAANQTFLKHHHHRSAGCHRSGCKGPPERIPTVRTCNSLSSAYLAIPNITSFPKAGDREEALRCQRRPARPFVSSAQGRQNPLAWRSLLLRELEYKDLPPSPPTWPSTHPSTPQPSSFLAQHREFHPRPPYTAPESRSYSSPKSHPFANQRAALFLQQPPFRPPYLCAPSSPVLSLSGVAL